MRDLSRKGLEFLFIVVLVYSIFSIVRNTCLLTLFYFDNSFIELDFDKNEIHEKMIVFNNYFYFAPYIIGTLLVVAVSFFYKFNKIKFLGAGLFGLIVFRLIDTSILRPLFAFVENTVFNVVLMWIIFILIFFTMIKFRPRSH